jgi:hypothetical protein
MGGYSSWSKSGEVDDLIKLACFIENADKRDPFTDLLGRVFGGDKPKENDEPEEYDDDGF